MASSRKCLPGGGVGAYMARWTHSRKVRVTGSEKDRWRKTSGRWHGARHCKDCAHSMGSHSTVESKKRHDAGGKTKQKKAPLLHVENYLNRSREKNER